MYILWAETQIASFTTILLKVEVWICLFVLNARSVVPKFDELQAVSLMLDPDIICITETWLSSGIEDQEIVLSGYYSSHLDRNRHGGDLVIFL